MKAKRCEQGWTQVQLADYAGTGKKARIDGGNFRVFAKTIGLNERQTDHAFSRIADSVEANLGDVLAVSLLSDEFTTRFKRLVRANLDWLVARRE